MMVFCTLFDSNYLDKGLMMYRSLVSVECNFKMYILAMDDKCKEILDSYHYPNLITIQIDDFVNELGLSEVHRTRTRGEFCWTCTPILIDYVLSKYQETICTYVDSDLCFYSNPQCLIDEMEEKTVQIVEHRYNHTMFGKVSHATSGTYCVEFNTFRNTSDALELLHWWMKRCLESCTIAMGEKGVWGDQGYLEDWGEKDNVSVLKNLGGGMAPWNIIQYQFISGGEKTIIEEKNTKKKFALVFYHFHNISYYDAHKANINIYEPWKEDRNLVKYLYVNYLCKINDIKNELRDNFGIYPFLASHPEINKMEKQKKKYLADYFRALDSLFIPKVYWKLIGNKLQQRYNYLNILNF